MSALGRRVALVEARLGAEAAAAWRKYHVAAQLARLVAGVVAGIVWAAAHAGISDWTSLVPVATGALWATLAQMWPQVPWWLLQKHGGAGGSSAAAPAASGTDVEKAAMPTPAPSADPARAAITAKGALPPKTVAEALGTPPADPAPPATG